MKKMTMLFKHSFIAALLFVATFSYGFEGQLQLLTRNYEHPVLKSWVQENAPLLSGLQRGIDLMKLDEEGELRFVQAADSLSQAHGFLSFDYRIYGVTASYTSDNAQSLLPKILGNIQSTFNVGSSIPFVLMISWFQHQTNQADILLYVQWNGFTRLIEYDETRRSLIESLTKDAYFETNVRTQSVPQQAMASTLSKFRMLLNPAQVGYFVIDGKKYTASDTFFTCQCSQTVRIAAYRNNNLPYTKSGSQKWSKAKYLFDNLGEVDRMKASPNSGTVIQADFTDSVGMQYTATLRVYVVDVDFKDAKGSVFGFDPNEITKYTATYSRDSSGGDFIRWKIIPKTFSDNLTVNVDPANIAHKVYFSITSGNVNPMKATSGNQVITITSGSISDNVLKTHVGNPRGCDYGKMKVLFIDTATIDIKYVIVNEEDDDTQLIKFKQGLPNSVGILAGPNNVIDSQLKPDDQKNGTSIQTGADGILNTTVQSDDVIAPKILKTGNGEINQIAIGLGANKFLDTNPKTLGGDDAIMMLAGNVAGIENGVNGITETRADSSTSNVNANFSSQLSGFNQVTSNAFKKVGIKIKSDLTLTQIDLNYDLDYDGLLNKPGLNEYSVLIKNYNIKNPSGQIIKYSKKIFVFIVQGYTGQINSNGGQTDGLSLSGSQTITIPLSLQSGGRSIAHEFAHGMFSLQDNISIRNFTTSDDPDNLMTYEDTNVPGSGRGTELRAFQWLNIAFVAKNLK